MNIEVLEFYPFEENKDNGVIKGTLKIRLPDQGMVIMGIFASGSKGRYFFRLPFRTGINHETGERVDYPTVLFEDKEKQKALIEAIREKGQLFIEARLADTERPLISSPKPPRAVRQGEEADEKQSRQEAKPAQLQATLPVATRPVLKEFRDPPPRKTAFTKSAMRSKVGWK